MFLSIHREDIYRENPLVLQISQHKEHSRTTDSIWLHFLFTCFPSSEKLPVLLLKTVPSHSSPFSMNLLLVSRIHDSTLSRNVEHIINTYFSDWLFSIFEPLKSRSILHLSVCSWYLVHYLLHER